MEYEPKEIRIANSKKRGELGEIVEGVGKIWGGLWSCLHGIFGQVVCSLSQGSPPMLEATS